MFDFHLDRFQYFKTQIENTETYVIPFIEKFSGPLKKDILEIGSAEGGVLKGFVNKGCNGVGVELEAWRVENAEKFLKEDIEAGRIQIYNRNIFDETFAQQFKEKFDLIVLKDVIEHIHGQEELLVKLKNYLRPGGMIYFGFPPWRMPFGGHQQICTSKILYKLPWYHILPIPLYVGILKAFGEKQTTINTLLEIKETRISIARFERITKSSGYKIIGKTHYLINPIYKYKFGFQPREQYKLITKIPWFRDFVTTCVYYLIQKK